MGENIYTSTARVERERLRITYQTPTSQEIYRTIVSWNIYQYTLGVALCS